MLNNFVRPKLVKLFKISISSLFLASGLASAKDDGQFKYANFSEVSAMIHSKIQQYGAKNVLVALDIDNTTMAMDHDLASEQWVLWQSKMINDGIFTQGAIAESISDLLDVQTYLTNLSPMHPVEKRIPIELSQFAQMGAKLMALTSRSPGMRESTTRELELANFPYASSSPDASQVAKSLYLPYDLTQIESSGLTKDDVNEYGLKQPRYVTLERGVFLTQGQHKGIMLRTLLHKLNQKYSAIIFIDDREHHLAGMQAAYRNRSEMVTTIQYTHEKTRIDEFNASDKLNVIKSWCNVSPALEELKRNNEPVKFIGCNE